MCLYTFTTVLVSKTPGYNCRMYPLVDVQVWKSNKKHVFKGLFWSNIAEGHLRVRSPHIYYQLFIKSSRFSNIHRSDNFIMEIVAHFSTAKSSKIKEKIIFQTFSRTAKTAHENTWRGGNTSGGIGSYFYPYSIYSFECEVSLKATL